MQSIAVSIATTVRLSPLVLALALTACQPGCVPVGPPTDGNGDGDGNGDVAGQALAGFISEDFVGSGNCAACHTTLADEAGNDVSIDSHWRSTMMASGARDPFFLAMVSSEIERAPALRETIEDVCATCHMPMARTQAVAEGSPVAILDDGFLDPDHPLHEVAMDGVSCSLCHQIQPDFLADPEGSFDGHFVIDTEATGSDRLLFGPYPQPQVPEVMQASVGFLPAYGEHMTRSGLCATCHTLFTPTLNAQGEIVGMFPEQTPFLEWQESEFGDGIEPDRQCQNCHMPVSDGAVRISRVPVGLNAREPFYQHRFLGGNVSMLRLLRDNIEDLGLTASTANFNETIAQTEAYLQNETADLTILSAEASANTLKVALEITNKTGHKFPTSFPSRRAWLHFTVTDGSGATVFESGAPGVDGAVAGDDADTDPTTFEPHYDVITSEDQVQLYQPIMLDSDGAVTYTLLRAASYGKDNRLLPSGFDKTSVGEDVAVQGAAVADMDFVGGSDQLTYQIDIAGRSGPFTVTAELLYQSVSYRFVADLRELTTTQTNQFTALYDAADKTPTTVASAQTVVP